MREIHLPGLLSDTAIKRHLDLEVVSQIRQRFGMAQMLTGQCQVNTIAGLPGAATGTGCTGPVFLYHCSSHGVQNLATRPQSPARGPDLGNPASFVPYLLLQIDRTPSVRHPSKVTYVRGFGSSHWIVVQEIHLNPKAQKPLVYKLCMPLHGSFMNAVHLMHSSHWESVHPFQLFWNGRDTAICNDSQRNKGSHPVTRDPY